LRTSPLWRLARSSVSGAGGLGRLRSVKAGAGSRTVDMDVAESLKNDIFVTLKNASSQ
jgi:hypothetical protein